MPPQMLLTSANFQQYLLTQIKIIPWLDRLFLKLLSKHMGIIFSNTLPFCSLAVVPAMEQIVPWARYLHEFCLCVGNQSMKVDNCRFYFFTAAGCMQSDYRRGVRDKVLIAYFVSSKIYIDFTLNCVKSSITINWNHSVFMPNVFSHCFKLFAIILEKQVCRQHMTWQN